MTANIRQHYALDFRTTYLNHGAFGAVPRVVTQAQRELRSQMDANPVRFFHREFAPLLDDTRGEFAAFVNCSPEDMVFVSNATEGICAILRSLNFEVGDEIVTTTLGYESVANGLAEIVGPKGVRIRKASIPLPLLDASSVVDAIANEVREKTKLVVVDHVASRSAIVLPVREICDVMRAKGIAVLVDGAHAPGMIDLDTRAIGATYYVGNCHKWISAPRGTAFVVVDAAESCAEHAHLRDQLRPTTVSHGASWKREGRSRFHDEFDWTGTRDYTAWLALPRALRFLDEVHVGGRAELRRQTRALCNTAIDALESLGALTIADRKLTASMATVCLGTSTTTTTNAFSKFLAEERQVEATVFSDLSLNSNANATGTFLRVSTWAYNTPHDIEVLVAAVAEGLKRFSIGGAQ